MVISILLTIPLLFIVTSFVGSVRCVGSDDFKFHQTAMSHAMEGNYDLALANFRAACRLNNKSALYWNDLGVTEMRVRQYALARRRFIKAMRIDPHFSTAAENLRDVDNYLGTNSDGKVHEKKQRHNLRPPRVLSHDDFRELSDNYYTRDDFFPNHLLLKPFIVRNYFTEEQDFNMTAINLDSLSNSYFNRRVDYYPHNMLLEQAHPYFQALGHAFRQLTRPEEAFVGVDASEPGTYVQWNVDLSTWRELIAMTTKSAESTCVSDNGASSFDTDTCAVPPSSSTTALPPMLEDTHWTSQCMSSLGITSDFYLKTHWKMLLVAEERAGMFNHKDVLRTASYQIQVQGSKKWHLCAPSQDQFVYNAGEVDMFAPDYVAFPRMKQASCYQFTLNPGDLVYYPHDYWHQTENLDTPTLAMTGTLVTAENKHLLRESLRKECRGEGVIFVPSDLLCADLERCYDVWDSMF